MKGLAALRVEPFRVPGGGSSLLELPQSLRRRLWLRSMSGRRWSRLAVVIGQAPGLAGTPETGLREGRHCSLGLARSRGRHPQEPSRHARGGENPATILAHRFTALDTGVAVISNVSGLVSDARRPLWDAVLTGTGLAA